MNDDEKLRQIFDEIQQLGGDATERFVEEVLQKSFDKKKLPPWFLGFRRTKKWSIEDRNGIDFVITTTRGEIRVDIKGSVAFAKRSRREHAKHDDDDHVVINANILDRHEVFLGRFITMVGDVWRKRK